MERIERLIEAVRREHAPDARTSVFDVHAERRSGGLVLLGEVTDESAMDALLGRIRRIAEAEVRDEVVRLPAPDLFAEAAVVRSALAPVHQSGRIASTQVSQYVMGRSLELLSRREDWWRVRGRDGYIGWIHRGYLETGTREWAEPWRDDGGGEPVVSLGAELIDEVGRVFARLPWGARLLRAAPDRYRLPDGRSGTLGSGEVMNLSRQEARFPARGESVARTARQWIGVAYLWGGVTPGGVDCSGLVQSLFWMHGTVLPRDTDQQAREGRAVDPGDRFEALRPGDLIFFRERPDRITHVAVSLGGAHIVHSALSNGGVEVNDLAGDLDIEHRLASQFAEARRIFPD